MSRPSFWWKELSETLLAVIWGGRELRQDEGPLCAPACAHNGPLSSWLAGSAREEAGGGQPPEGGQVRAAEIGDGKRAVVPAAVEPAEFEEAGEQGRGKRPGQVRFPFGPVEALAGEHAS